MLEVSFDFLMYHSAQKVLGKAYPRFQDEFPIRFDFLDTFDGGNLSVQVHPKTAYNIKRGFENLDFTIKGDQVKENFISKPILLETQGDTTIYHLPTHSRHFYDVHRYEFTTQIKITTNGNCHILSLVEGDAIKVITTDEYQMDINYAETFIIPAACEEYVLINKGAIPVKVVMAFVK